MGSPTRLLYVHKNSVDNLVHESFKNLNAPITMHTVKDFFYLRLAGWVKVFGVGR